MAGFCSSSRGSRACRPSRRRSVGAVSNWSPGHTIHFRHKTPQVLAVRDNDADQPPTLVVEDA
jgi:hypothetical protein